MKHEITLLICWKQKETNKKNKQKNKNKEGKYNIKQIVWDCNKEVVVAADLFVWCAVTMGQWRQNMGTNGNNHPCFGHDSQQIITEEFTFKLGLIKFISPIYAYNTAQIVVTWRLH